MTRQVRNLAPSAAADNSQMLRPIHHARSLAEAVVERIELEISGGRLRPGARLPTEQEIMAAMGVSRTVVREAIAALRARGFVVTRQGAGAFVNADASKRPYVIDPEGLGSLRQVIEVLELRMAVEVETAALASQRASLMQIKAIRLAQHAFGQAIERGKRGIIEDFAFHRAIAIATGNSRFTEFLEFLGRIIIPRQSIRTFVGRPTELRSYLRRIEKEHDAILAAIEGRSPVEARRAMRQHLSKSCERYRQLASEAHL
jgi:GntR family transcriptional regulator, transcriptional repressor for pyruvate dehydrogenase complex